jgi:hypothetical protein
VALGRLELLQPLLAGGQLALLAGHGARPSPYAFWLLQAEPAPRADVQRVAAWIRAEAAGTAALSAS